MTSTGTEIGKYQIRKASHQLWGGSNYGSSTGVTILIKVANRTGRWLTLCIYLFAAVMRTCQCSVFAIKIIFWSLVAQHRTGQHRTYANCFSFEKRFIPPSLQRSFAGNAPGTWRCAFNAVCSHWCYHLPSTIFHSCSYSSTLWSDVTGARSHALAGGLICTSLCCRRQQTRLQAACSSLAWKEIVEIRGPGKASNFSIAVVVVFVLKILSEGER